MHPTLTDIDLKNPVMSTSPADKTDKEQKDDRTQQRYQHGGYGDRIVDGSDTKNWAEEVTGQKRAYHCHHNVDQQVRFVMHNIIGCYPTDNSRCH